MKNQKERSREDASVESGDWIVLSDIEGTEFTGYDKLRMRFDNKIPDSKGKRKGGHQLVFNKTPFYAESGGQAGDSGIYREKTKK